MRVRRLLPFCLLAIAIASTGVTAQSRPFKGSWTGVTVSADETNLPVVSIVSEGDGQLTHLGRYTMVSPHTTNVTPGNGFTAGEQIFTAANGDTLTAYCEGAPQPDFSTGNLVVSGTLDCEIVSGTGRFEGATGSYEFALVATLAGFLENGALKFATEAEITGEIEY